MFPGGAGATAEGAMIADNVVEIGLWFHDENCERVTDVCKTSGLYPLHVKGTENGHLIIPPNGYAMTQGLSRL